MIMLTKAQWAKRAFLTTFFGTIAIVAIIGLLFGKVIEATLLEEVIKWAIMAVVLGGIMCVVFYAPILLLGNIRNEYYSKHGRKWFIAWLKNDLRLHDNNE